VSFDDWLLALHVLSAFAYVAGIVLFWILVVAVRRTDTPDGTVRMGPVVKVGNASVGIGAGGTIVFGIAALVLWALAAATGSRTGAAYMAGMTKAEELRAAGQKGASAELLALNRTQRGLVMHAASSLIVLLILIDMIWKPGA